MAEVSFIMGEIARDELPGWSKYITVFQEARRQRRSQSGTKRSQDERMVVERIESSSRSATIPLLLCIDNGHGLDGVRMDALLTPGNTSKGERGAGSFGLGTSRCLRCIGSALRPVWSKALQTKMNRFPRSLLVIPF